MLFTRASEYALLSMVIIAKQENPQDVDTLSKQLGISKSFLAKILQHLAKKGILKSFKGASGGFVLGKNPGELSLLEIVWAVEGKPASVFECSPGIECCPNKRAQSCAIWPFLNRLQHRIDDFLRSLTLEDIIAE